MTLKDTEKEFNAETQRRRDAEIKKHFSPLIIQQLYPYFKKTSFFLCVSAPLRLCVKASYFYLSTLFILLSGCSPSQEGGFKVAATPVPHAQMLEFIKPDLKEKGVDLQIIITEDYNIPNRALANNEVDANFFQHLAFMEEQIAQFNYPIESLAAIEIEPMGIYSKKLTSLADLPEGAKIAIPNDPTNEARALRLLQSQGLITLDSPDSFSATILNIKDNPKKLQFIEIDAAMLPRTLEDVAAAAINTNFALEAKLVPEKDALVLESRDSPYANIIAIRIGDESRQDIQIFKEVMTSEKMQKFILEEYKGAILPAF